MLLFEAVRMLANVAVESRLEQLPDDASESLEARLVRAADINIRVSCSDIGEGPGTGGKGLAGGAEGGGFGDEGGFADDGGNEGEGERGLTGI